MLVQGAATSATSAEISGGVRGWAVEFDGPSHFMACASPTGATLLKHRHLRLLGHNLVVVPYWEWDCWKGCMDSEVQYLRDKLDEALLDEARRGLDRSNPH